MGVPLHGGYDSHLSPGMDELVIFDVDQILPCYICHYATQGECHLLFEWRFPLQFH